MNLITIVGHVSQDIKIEVNSQNREMVRVIVESRDENYNWKNKLCIISRMHTFYFPYYNSFLPPINSRVAQNLKFGDIVSVIGYIEYDDRDEDHRVNIMNYPKLIPSAIMRVLSPEEYKNTVAHEEYVKYVLDRQLNLFANKNTDYKLGKIG